MLAERINLDTDEVIIRIVRKHWFIITVQILGLLVGLVVPIAVHIVILKIPAAELFTAGVKTPFMVYAYAMWSLVLWIALFNMITNYYLDVWTLTNKRLIVVDQQGLFHRHTGSFRLERVQDINVSLNGIIPTLLNFGTLEVQTASGDRDFHAMGLPDPQGFKALIFKAADERMDRDHRVDQRSYEV